MNVNNETTMSAITSALYSSNKGLFGGEGHIGITLSVSLSVHLSIFLVSATPPKQTNWYWWNFTQLYTTTSGCTYRRIILVWKISREITICTGSFVIWLTTLVYSIEFFCVRAQKKLVLKQDKVTRFDYFGDDLDLHFDLFSLMFREYYKCGGCISQNSSI